MRLVTTLIAALTLMMSGCGKPNATSELSEAWNPFNDPFAFGSLAGTAFESLPLQGRLGALPWSGDYWPSYKGGIGQRWQIRNPSPRFQDHLYPILSQESAVSLTNAEIALLSPTEKYDLAMGSQSFDLTRTERERILGSVREGEIPTWFGLCHGWAAASIREREPGTHVDVPLQDGRAVRFYASDMRALLTKIYGTANLNAMHIGQRCSEKSLRRLPDGRVESSRCRDANPGAFHLVVADQIAVKRKPFIMDVVPSAEVWNQPIVGYRVRYGPMRFANESDPWQQVRAPGTTYLIDIEMLLEYAAERSPSPYVHGAFTRFISYAYTLELDAETRIIGGEWLSEERPDFLWTFADAPSGTIDGIDVEWVRSLRDASLNAPEPTPPEGPEQPGEPPVEPEEPEEPEEPHNPEGSLIIDFVSTSFRGRHATANNWVITDAPEQSFIMVRVLYGNGRLVLVASVNVEQNGRWRFNFDYSPVGATHFVYELYNGRSELLDKVQRPVP